MPALVVVPDGLALRHQPGGGGQQARPLHLPSDLVEHAAGIHRKARHLWHAGLDRHAGQRPGPRLKLMRPGAGAGRGRIAKGRLQPEPEGLGVQRHDDIAIGRHRILDRCQRIAAVAQQFRVQQRLLRPQRGAGEGHLGETAHGGRSIGRLERKRHLRPRPLGSCHRVLLGLSGSGQRVGR